MLPAKTIEVALTRLLSHARPRIKISAFRGSFVASQRRRSKSESQTPEAIPLHSITVFQSGSLGLLYGSAQCIPFDGLVLLCGYLSAAVQVSTLSLSNSWCEDEETLAC
jgi:hypothetical protein